MPDGRSTWQFWRYTTFVNVFVGRKSVQIVGG